MAARWCAHTMWAMSESLGEAEVDELQGSAITAQPDEQIDFSHLKSRRGLTQLELEDEVASDLQRATGIADTANTDANRLNRVLQLTGRPSQLPSCPQCGGCCIFISTSVTARMQLVECCPSMTIYYGMVCLCRLLRPSVR